MRYDWLRPRRMLHLVAWARNAAMLFSMLDHQTERTAAADVLSMFSDKLLEKNPTLTFERDLGKPPLKGNLLVARPGPSSMGTSLHACLSSICYPSHEGIAFAS